LPEASSFVDSEKPPYNRNILSVNGPPAKDGGFMKHALSALLALFVIGSALGQSPAKVRITTWNLEWFPNGSAHDATTEIQAQRIQAAADVLKNQSNAFEKFIR
jgi:hypothetical protein